MPEFALKPADLWLLRICGVLAALSSSTLLVLALLLGQQAQAKLEDVSAKVDQVKTRLEALEERIHQRREEGPLRGVLPKIPGKP